MTISIRQILATPPSGLSGMPPLEWDELGAYLRKYCDTIAEKQRNARHCLRDELYRDGGVEYMETEIDRLFRDPTVRELRKAWVRNSRWSNPIKRIVNQLSIVYSEPARRSVGGSESNQQRYTDLLDAVAMDERMLHVGRLLNLHRALLIRFRVRVLPSEFTDPQQQPREPVLEWATPANARAVLHPNDNTLVVGWLIRASHRPAHDSLSLPAWELWTDHERVSLRADFGVITESYVEHQLGLNPWVPISLSPPGAGFWPGEEGEDLVAGTVMAWLVNVLLGKETKSANKQPVIQGDGARLARGQAADSEVPIELSDGQTVTTIDMGTDLEQFEGVGDHIIEHLSLNYGMSAALVNQQGVQSAEAREMMMVPLKEERKRQHVPLRRGERQVARVMSAVTKVDLPEHAFDDEGWAMQFGEASTPMTRKDEVDLFEQERGAVLDNTVDFYMRSHPGMTEPQALAAIERNIELETMRNELMRPMQAISGSPGATTPAAPGSPPPPPPPPSEQPSSDPDLRRIAREIIDAG